MSQIILRNKPKLIKWLVSGYECLLQHVQAKQLITMSQYSELIDITGKEKGVIKLLDIILGKGEDVCRQFLDLLKEDDVNEFSPELREWTKTVDTKGTANMTGPSDTKVPHQTPDRDCEHRPIQDYQKFLKETYSKLIQKVKNIDPIIDDLDLHDESVANVRAKSTNQEKMRKLLDCVNCESIAKDLFNALWKHEKPLMNELLNN
ncbi:uncharacterized protein LOC127170420 [Labeo rohita]|uniref:uncharacterized protein LOC127170420 n=1 Tax=Labeo rohita TaxID=84645 RepID=UPI0021E1FF59|nr:uncharacterized protein LOC127170420 [Labeo rohita]